eukprot:9881415-Karenia_brevis.AAC.1
MGLGLAPRKKEWSKLCEGFCGSDTRLSARQQAEKQALLDQLSSSSDSSSSSSSARWDNSMWGRNIWRND